MISELNEFSQSVSPCCPNASKQVSVQSDDTHQASTHRWKFRSGSSLSLRSNPPSYNYRVNHSLVQPGLRTAA